MTTVTSLWIGGYSHIKIGKNSYPQFILGRIIMVIPLVIGWIYNRLPIVADLRGTTPRTVRQPYWNRVWIMGQPSTYRWLTTMYGKGGSYHFKKVWWLVRRRLGRC